MSVNLQIIADAKQSMLYGALWCIGGAFATAATDGHVLFYGAFLVGGYQFLSGLFRFLGNGGLSQLNNESSSNNSYSYSTTLKCFNCHRPNDNDVKYCIYCGAALKNSSKNSNPPHESLFGYAITLIAYVAKADGVVSKNEAVIISELLTHIADGNTAARNVLKDVYERAKNDSPKNHKAITDKFIAIGIREFSESDRYHFNKIFTRWLVLLVYADGSKNIPQNLIVSEITQQLRIEDSYLKELHNEFAQHKEKDTRSYQSESHGINDSYSVLKCKSSDTDDEIKKAYRELAKQYHPDVISSKGLAEDFILFANQKFKEINTAYEAIKKHRGMK